MNAYTKALYSRKTNLIIRTLLACLIATTLSMVTLPAWANDDEAAAQKAFDNWKAAKEKVEQKEADVKAAEEALNNAKAAMKDDKNPTDSEKHTQQVLQNAIDKAKAELRAARAEEIEALGALTEALQKLGEDNALRKELMRQRDILMGLKKTSLSPQTQQIVQTKTAGGLYVTTFDTAKGRIIVNLPDDMRAGDTISGTVVAEPKGSTDQERSRNTAELSGYVVELSSPKPRNDGDKKPPPNIIVILEAAKSNGFKITLPDTKTGQKLLHVNLRQLAQGERSKFGASNYSLKENEPAPGRIFATSDAYMEVSEPEVWGETANFSIPPLGQTGRPIVITGPFDGNSLNTKVEFGTGENPIRVMQGIWSLAAESPRKAVFTSPSDVTGPMEVHLREGNTETTGLFRNVGVNLTAPKTNLFKGEKTELRIEVSGLQGIKEPVPLTLESRGVITMAGGAYQSLVIQPSQVGTDGRYSTTREVTGVQAGGWSATATVVTHSMDVKLEGQNCATVLLFNSSTGDYTFNCPTCSYEGGAIVPRDQLALFSIAPIGRGSVAQKGCTLTLNDNTPGRRVMATVDQCAKTGTATVEVPASKVKFTITDRNTTDSTCSVH